jgi:hypothetical protein
VSHATPSGRNRKHRHDTGNPDHGPLTTERTTVVIQFLLASALTLTGALMMYALLSTGAPR